MPNLTVGGAERVVVTLLNHLDSTLFDLTLAVVNGKGADILKGELAPRIKVIDLKVSRVRYCLAKLGRLIWRLRPDAVFRQWAILTLP